MLLAVKRISRSSCKRYRIVLGAVAGGLSALLIFFERLGLLMTILKILSAVLMILISFGFESRSLFLKRCFWLFAVCFLFGGFMFFLYMVLKKDAFIYTNGIIYFDVNMTFLVVCTVISYCIISFITYLTDKKAPRKNEYEVTIQLGELTVIQQGLMDSGNNLRDAFTGYPVVVIDKKLFAKLTASLSNERFRLIPIVTVNGEAVIRAFRPDFIRLDGMQTDKVYVGESLMPLNEYKIILNVNLEGENYDKKNEKAFCKTS